MTEALAWTLLHSLWQGALIGSLVAAAGHGQRPQVRHMLLLLGLGGYAHFR